jgi:uncharacterized BrkB/YihY/UPF0761 family membrane protein
MAKTTYKLSKKQQVTLFLSVTLFISGIVLSVLSLFGEYGLPRSDNWVNEGELAVSEFLSISLTWLQWGSILIVVGSLLFSLILSVAANAEQVQREKASRRAQRLQDTLES